MKDLMPVRIKGPNGSWIYILAKPEHHRLFNDQVRSQVRKRRPTLESITRARKHAFYTLVPRIAYTNGETSLYGTGDVEEGHFSLANLDNREIKRLKRLSMWLAPGETPLMESDFFKEEIPI